jgi:hypothetical protein
MLPDPSVELCLLLRRQDKLRLTLVIGGFPKAPWRVLPGPWRAA